MDEARFRALMSSMELLLEQGHQILFIRLLGTADRDRAVRHGGLAGTASSTRYGDRFVTSPVWESYAHVVLAMQHLRGDRHRLRAASRRRPTSSRSPA